MIAFDTETHLIEMGCLAPRLVCISTYQEGRTELVDREGALLAAERLLSEDIIVGHNTAFDMGVLGANYPELLDAIWLAYEENRVRDTMIRAQLIAIALDRFEFDPDVGKPSFSLAGLAKKYLGIHLEKEDTWRLRYAELDGIPAKEWPKEAIEYAKDDAEVTALVWEAMANLGTPQDEALQNRAHWALHLASCWGLRTDQRAVSELKAKLISEVEVYESDLVASEVLRDKKNAKGRNIKNMSEIRRRVQEDLGDDTPFTQPSKRYPEGQISASEETLRLTSDPELLKLAGILKAASELSKFIYKLTPVVNPRFRVVVRTGRTSSFSPNIQQMPRRAGVRECFIPRDGYVYIAADYSIAELCALAEILQDMFGWTELGETIRAFIDPHRLLGAEIMGWTLEEMNERHEAGDKKAKDARQLAKAANFGFPGGLGINTFVVYAKGSWGVDITLDEAAELKERWFARYPEMRSYFAEIGSRGAGHTTTQFRSGRVRGGLNFTNGCNTLFQGLVADGAKDALWEVSKLCYAGDIPIKVKGRRWLKGVESREHTYTCEFNPLLGCRPVAFIHDEILMEAPIRQAEYAAKALEQTMELAMGRWIQTVPIKAEARIMERWRK